MTYCLLFQPLVSLTLFLLVIISFIRRDENRQNANDLMAKLKDDLQLKQFLEDSNDVIDWMNERYQSASDESYKDVQNVRSKLQKHAAFEAELEANKVKIEALKEVSYHFNNTLNILYYVQSFCYNTHVSSIYK